LRQRLLQRFPAEQVEAVLREVKVQGYLDDTEFAVHWRESRERTRPRSASLIRRELAHRGVDGALIEQALVDFDEERNALAAARKWLAHGRGLDYPTFTRRLGAFLQRRGFASSLVRKVTREMWEESAGSPLSGDVDGQKNE
jgi:regulatory protein